MCDVAYMLWYRGHIEQLFSFLKPGNIARQLQSLTLVEQIDLYLKSPALFTKADSSPLGGRDWLLHEWQCIPNQKLLEVFKSSIELAQLNRLSKLDPQEPDDDNDRWQIKQAIDERAVETKRLEEHINKHIESHIGVPTAMGARATDLVHKFCNILHSVHLEVGSLSWVACWGHFGRDMLGAQNGLCRTLRRPLRRTLCRTLRGPPKGS